MTIQINAKHNAKLNMYRTTEKHVDDNASVVAGNPAFQTAFTKLKTNIVAIQNTAQQKSAAMTTTKGRRNEIADWEQRRTVIEQ